MKTILAASALVSALWVMILPGWWAVLPVAVWAALATGLTLTWLLDYEPRHALIAVALTTAPAAPYGSMSYDAEIDWRARARLLPLDPGRAVSGPGGDVPKTMLIDGHTPGCLCPEGLHHWTACPEEDDWPDDDETPGPLPDMLPAGPPTVLVDAPLASAAAAAEDAGWTDQLLAELHDAPTVLDRLPVTHPEPSRLADTGEIELISLRAEYAAQLRAQDDESAEFISRMVTETAAWRLAAHGL